MPSSEPPSTIFSILSNQISWLFCGGWISQHREVLPQVQIEELPAMLRGDVICLWSYSLSE